MPRRAIFSTLLLLVGTLSGSAASLSPAARSATFQPRSTLSAAVLKPAEARFPGSEQRLLKLKVQSATPVWQAQTEIKPSLTAFNQPAGVVVRPAVIKTAGGS